MRYLDGVGAINIVSHCLCSSGCQGASTLIESPETDVAPMIPPDYIVFEDVFSKQAATHLPSHRPWDCAMDLLPDAKLRKGRVYPLSILECKAMK